MLTNPRYFEEWALMKAAKSMHGFQALNKKGVALRITKKGMELVLPLHAFAPEVIRIASTMILN
eukprot:scaffold66826_cov16-Tisochrysis_lutea.AAC.3